MENDYKKKFYKKWWFYLIVIFIILGAGTGYYFYTAHAAGKMSENNFNKNISINKEGTVILKDKTKAAVKVRSENEIYDEIHKMANTKIVAEDNKVWGQIKITPEVCNKLIVELSYSNYADKDALIKWLMEWKNKNYSSSVEIHNYVWSKLNGNVGKATELKK
ncbi:hypothetical protein CPAST_c16720 [Clostridium pasteurianum DSM 525 = ATCC 6013]|uniref:Uncharacterized protein n=1 Tax=Clostridium pasteurianum DSM 525 = ATCC 6013 TaxID=1262449 RepID=A0A0H3J4D0_CLOPA|nr:DUF6241 domain-containing protein [Clostridium pasteurianum]AJA47742.1 hypothetical protein CPAST_c16720 [Clostridium pasteurianum DSM 525 = ATCC 6013]AJA51730.1 hypothetical protein CLPA_c16720 [Clostridium pasteurianum DSM 525 = ATCC 6013]AOZ75041.1 hypothetical protein AQ983_08090 [Clostridium pasteurianum DSM 525 = ATCC 6013]AOZ78836.1 hypothetical protein AQ984_08080 [Clostridium pasteurianum]ELP59645.1 hypothetical protein F502_07268 [Clostridium pasteurianum DSM 525 = ATCC 6013]